MTPDESLAAVRAACLALPEVEERLSHGAPAFFIKGKKSVATVWVHGHHQDDYPHLWCAAPAGAQEAYVASDPDRFFVPPYVGHRGWLGVRRLIGIRLARDLAVIGSGHDRCRHPVVRERRLGD